MLNMNSPTVQAMLNKTPNGVGNIPMYYGSAPVIAGAVEPVQQQNPTTPFPSPKEMLINGNQSMAYQTSFAPRNIVGGYNPGYNAMFSGYSNPYMGYGSYGGVSPYGYINRSMPMDNDDRERQMLADINRLTYAEQLEEESNVYKTISRIVSKNIGRTEEEAEECEKAFDIYDKYPKREEFSRRKFKPIHVQVKVGDEVVADFDPEKSKPITQSTLNEYKYNVNAIEIMKNRQAYDNINRVNRMNAIYDNAPERQFDNMDLYDFLNYGSGVIMADMMTKKLQKQKLSGVAQLYDQEAFKEALLKKNGLRSRKKKNAIERFAGRYGVMPDGRPISPGRDPAIAESFSYDPNTGRYTITAPNFIQQRLEQARQSFINSLDQ